MTVTLDFAEFYTDLLDHSQIENCVLTTLEYQGVSTDSDLSIMIDNDPRIQQLNQEFMGIDAPTDVLAFPAGHLDPDTGRVNLGDVIISLPQAKSQADLAGHHWQRKLICWSFMEYFTCSSMITMSQMEKQRCGQLKQKF